MQDVQPISNSLVGGRLLLRRINHQDQDNIKSNTNYQLLQHHQHPHHNQQQQPQAAALKCPRCDSLNTKFCYYNNYNLSQPRHFCKNCRRYWTKGGVLRNVPVGGGCRKSKRSSKPKSSSTLISTSSKKAAQNNNINNNNSHSSSESSSTPPTVNGGALFQIPEVENFGLSSDIEPNLFSGDMGGFMNLINNNENHNNSNLVEEGNETASFSEYLFVILHTLFKHPKMATQFSIKDDDVDIVIGALQSDLTSFMNAWKPIFSRFHLIIVKDPELKEDLKIPDGFDVKIYTKADMDKTAGASLTSQLFSGYSCRYFGYLVSNKKYVISIDDDCIPAKDDKGFQVDAVAQHLFNLAVPATPLFFNTLYDPFCKGADFVRGYPFSMREGVPCALSCGLWLNLADLDAPTQALKPEQRNTRYVDAVLTVPAKALMPLSGINIGFNRELLGPALFPGLKLTKEGKLRWETMEDVFSGMCVKVVCDHLKFGVKTGLPYVWREERGDAVQSLKKDWEGMKLMEDAVPFFESIKLPAEAVKAEDCILEVAKLVKERFAAEKNSVFIQAADAMTEWVKLWKKVVPACN